MARIEILAPFILAYEGGYANVPFDKGGSTNMGVTLKTWQQLGEDKNGDGKIDVGDLRLLTVDDVVEKIMRPHFWNKCQGDKIRSQAIANMIVDWCWHSGPGIIKRVQRAVLVRADGIVGPITVEAINKSNEIHLYCLIHDMRKEYLNGIIRRDPTQQRFRKGWMRRVNAIKIDRLELPDGRIIKF